MSLGSMEQRTEGMKKQAQELIEQAYQRGFKAGQEKAFVVDSNKFKEQGRDEAWEAAKKIYLPIKDGGLFEEEIQKIFGVELFTTILKEFSVSEVIEKLRAYEEQEKQEEDKEIHVGDEVILNAKSSFGANTKAIVIAIDKATYPYRIMDKDSDTDWVGRDEIDHKTGRHFPEIAEVMKKMMEDEK